MNPLYKQYGTPQNSGVTNNGNAFGKIMGLANPRIKNITNAIQEARQIMTCIKNPQEYVLSSLKELGINIPAQIQNNPDQIRDYLINNVLLNDAQKQILGL